MDATLCRKLPNDVIMKIINHATHAANQEYHEDRIKINIPAPLGPQGFRALSKEEAASPAGTFLTSLLERNRARFRPTITLRIPEDEYNKLNWSCGRVSWVERQHRRIITEFIDFSLTFTRGRDEDPSGRSDHLLPSDYKHLYDSEETTDDDDY